MTTATQPIPLDFPPGVVAVESEYSTPGRVVEAQLVRWRGRNPVPFGGWREIVGTADGCGRSIFSWIDNNGVKWTAIGTHLGVFVHDGDNFTDITPSDWTASSEFPGIEAGYGTGWYGTGEYGTPIGDETEEGSAVMGQALDFGYIHFDNWGDTLLFCSVADGRLFQWTVGDAEGTLVADAPVGIRGVCVTPEGHCVVLGQEFGDPLEKHPRRIAWCSIDDLTDWTAGPVDSAGDLDVRATTLPIRILKFGGQTYFFTQSSLHLLEYQGYPNVYAIRNLREECGLICPQAVAVSAARMLWRSPQGFFQFDGANVNPIKCDLEGRLLAAGFPQLEAHRKTVVVGHNEMTNEFMCFYPALGSNNPNRYVAWAYLDGYWTEGQMERTAWGDTTDANLPLAIYYDGTDSRLMEHEYGYERPYNTVRPFFRVGPFEIASGAKFTHIDRLIQDVPNNPALLEVTFTFKKAPQGETIKTVGPSALDTARGYTDLRGNGRSVEFTVQEAEAAATGFWQWGLARLNVAPASGN